MTMGRSQNLTWSLKVADRGPGILIDSGYDLTTLRLGQLLRERGYEPQGADSGANFSGTLPWRGTVRELDQQATTRDTRRRQAEAALTEALLTDAERATREAEDAALRDAFNAMRVKGSGNGTYLVAYHADGRLLPIEEMTEVQRQAFQRATAAHRGVVQRYEMKDP